MSRLAPGDTRTVEDVVDAVLATTSRAAAIAVLRGRHDDWRAVACTVLDEGSRLLRRDPSRALVVASAVHSRLPVGEASELGATALRLGGQALVQLGRLRGGLSLLDRALARARAAGAEPLVAVTQVRRMDALAQLGRHDDARAAGADAWLTFDRLDEPRGMLQVDVGLGNLAIRLDRYREGLRHLRRARTQAEALCSPRVTAIVDVNVAVCLEGQHRYRAAARYLARARQTFDGEGLDDEVAQIDANRAHLEFVRGRFAPALDLYLRAEETFRRLDQGRRLARCHVERAELLLQMAMPSEARALAREAATEFEGEGLGKDRAQALVAAALADLLEGRPESAATDLAVAGRLFRAEGNDLWTAECGLLSALAAEARGDVDLARSLAHSAQETFLRDGHVARAGSTDLLLARLDLASQRPSRALANVEMAERRTRRVDAPWLRVELRRARGLAHIALGDLATGVTYLLEAVAALEAHRGGLPADEFMVAFLSSKAALYAETAEALVECGRESDAFDLVERARSRALVDMMAGRDESVRRSVRAHRSDLRARRLAHQRAKLNDVYSRLHRAATSSDVIPPEREEALRAAAGAAETSISEMLRQEWARDPELLSLSAVAALDVGGVQALLGADTTLVEYFLSRSRLIVFVVTRDRFECRVTDVDPRVLRRLVQRFRFHLSRFNLRTEDRHLPGDLHLVATRANLAALSQVLLEPVLELLRTPRLLIVPHGDLHGLPFHALPLGDGWVADRYRVWYAPSATVFGFCAAKGKRATGPVSVVACADEAAPGIDAEARAVAAGLPEGGVALHLGAAATSTALREAAATSRVLHVAAHGMYRAGHPLLSSLRLADTWLNAYDVYDLDVRAEMVTLAACESGVAAITGGEEVLGLVRGFLFAGAPRLLVSQWRVHDETTTRFMETLYRNEAETGSWERATDAAMSEIRRTHPHPYHWAPFFLIGYPQPTGASARRPRLRHRGGRHSRGGECR